MTAALCVVVIVCLFVAYYMAGQVTASDKEAERLHRALLSRDEMLERLSEKLILTTRELEETKRQLARKRK